MSERVAPGYKQAYKFHRSEAWTIILLALIFAFAITFRMWGSEEFNAAIGMFNLTVAFLGMLLLVLFHELGHKQLAAYHGYETKSSFFISGNAVSFFLVLATNGYIPIAIPNLLSIEARPDLRLRKFRKHENPSTMAVIASAGFVANIAFIAIFMLLFSFFEWPVLQVLVLGAVLHAVYSLIPWELATFANIKRSTKDFEVVPGDWFYIWFYSKTLWSVLLVLFILLGIFALWTNTFTMITVLVISILAIIGYRLALR